MDNQHKMIKGYRDLSQEEIDLMNKLKEHGEITKGLLKELHQMVKTPVTSQKSHERFEAIHNATMYLKTGQMWLVRAVALPDSF